MLDNSQYSPEGKLGFKQNSVLSLGVRNKFHKASTDVSGSSFISPAKRTSMITRSTSNLKERSPSSGSAKKKTVINPSHAMPIRDSINSTQRKSYINSKGKSLFLKLFVCRNLCEGIWLIR